MKKLISCILLATIVLMNFSCSSNVSTTNSNQNETTIKETPVSKKEVIVFAAASMTEVLNKIKTQFEKENQNIEIIYNFDSSGTLKTQIETGASCDIFISAAPKQMNQLDITADSSVNTAGLDFIDSTTRSNYVENKVALCISQNSQSNVKTYDDLAEALRQKNIMFAMGNSDVPVGQYTQKILAYYNLSEEELANAGVITYGTNVKEVTTQIKENLCDAGIIYATDAFSAGLTVSDTATKEMCGQVIYPIAMLKNSVNKNEAKIVLDYFKSNYAKGVLEEVGFTPLF